MAASADALRREVVALALPAVVEQLILFAVSLVETFLAGHLGASSLAALGLSTQLAMLSTALFMPLGVGAGVMVAQAIGAREIGRAHRVLGQAVWLTLVAGLLLAVVGVVFARPALELIGLEPAALPVGAILLQLLAASMPFYGLLLVLNSCLRGAGDTRTPMLIIGVATGVQIVSAFGLVNGWAGLPPMSTRGIGVGALLGRGIGVVLLLGSLWRGRLRLALAHVPWRPDLKTAEAILRLGAPAGGEQLALRLGQTANVSVVAGLGTAAYAAYLVTFNTVSLAFLVGIGFTIATTTVVGQRVGASRPTAAREGAHQAWGIAALTMGLMGVAFILGAGHILRFFTSEPQVVHLAILPLQMVALVLPVEATNQILSGALRGAGDTRWPMVVTATGNWVIRLPLTLLLAGSLGLIGAWLAVIADIALRAAANIWRFRGESWLQMKQPQLKGVAQ